MGKRLRANELLDYFNVENHQKLMKYIEENPTDDKVIEIKEILAMFDINLDNGGDKFE